MDEFSSVCSCSRKCRIQATGCDLPTVFRCRRHRDVLAANEDGCRKQRLQAHQSGLSERNSHREGQLAQWRPRSLRPEHRALTETKWGHRGMETKGRHALPVRPADCVIVTNFRRGVGITSSLEGIVLLLILLGVAVSAELRLPPQPCGSNSHHFRVSVNNPLKTFQRMAGLIVNVTVPAPGWHKFSRIGERPSRASNSRDRMNAETSGLD